MQDAPYREVPLFRRDGSIACYTLVDLDDYERLKHYRWQLDSKGYVYRHERIALHRAITGLEYGDARVVDHINGDPLDNRKANLAVGTRGQNQQNRNKRPNSTSRHRGVTRYRDGRWMAQARLDGKTYFLGYYENEDEAGRVAAEFRAEHMPFSQEARARARSGG